MLFPHTPVFSSTAPFPTSYYFVIIFLLKLTNRKDSTWAGLVYPVSLTPLPFSPFPYIYICSHVPGRVFPVEVAHSAEDLPRDWPAVMVETILDLHLKQPLPGDILAFLTGQAGRLGGGRGRLAD